MRFMTQPRLVWELGIESRIKRQAFRGPVRSTDCFGSVRWELTDYHRIHTDSPGGGAMGKIQSSSTTAGDFSEFRCRYLVRAMRGQQDKESSPGEPLQGDLEMWGPVQRSDQIIWWISSEVALE